MLVDTKQQAGETYPIWAFFSAIALIGNKKATFAQVLRALSFHQNWPAKPASLQRKCNNLKEHLHNNPSYSYEGVYIILDVF